MDTINEIINLVSKHSGVSTEKINGNMFIEEDLKMTGDDALEIMEDIQEKYSVDLNDFEFSLHFSPEAGTYVSNEYGYYPVSINHLVEITNAKNWKLPERNEENYKKTKYRLKTNKIYKTLFFIITATIVYLLNYA